MRFGINFAVFLIFFGVAALEAVRSQDWPWVLFWTLFGLIFLWADRKQG